MRFIAVYDADVLYPNTLRDLLIRIAQLPHLVQAKWTEKILDEVTDNLRKNMPDITAEKTNRLRQLMNTAVRDCLVSGYEPLIAALDLPDPNDRHVLAAAIRAKAQIIVTKNLRDFPAERLAPWDIKAKSPDSFVRDQIDIDRQAVYVNAHVGRNGQAARSAGPHARAPAAARRSHRRCGRPPLRL